MRGLWLQYRNSRVGWHRLLGNGGSRVDTQLSSTLCLSRSSTRSSKSVSVSLRAGIGGVDDDASAAEGPREEDGDQSRRVRSRPSVARKRPRKPTPAPSSRTSNVVVIVGPCGDGGEGKTSAGRSSTSSASRSEAPHVRRPVVPCEIVFCSSASVTCNGWSAILVVDDVDEEASEVSTADESDGDADDDLDGWSLGCRARGKKNVLYELAGGAEPPNGVVPAVDDPSDSSDVTGWRVDR
jgi:hypothetical protein